MSKQDAYVEKAQAKIDELKAKTRGAISDRKIEMYDYIENLESALASAKLKVTKVTDAVEDTWGEVAVRFDDLSEDLRAATKKFFAKKG